MANRAVLMLKKECWNESLQAEQGNIFFLADYIIPILWFSLYTPGDICTLQVDALGTGETILIPALCAPVSVAKRRSAQRLSVFLQYFPARLAPIYKEWLNRLETVHESYIEIEVVEIFGLDPDSFEESLIVCTRAYEDDRLDDWIVLIEQAGLRFDPIKKRAVFDDSNAAAALCGYPATE